MSHSHHFLWNSRSVTNSIIANVAGVVAENVAVSHHDGLRRGRTKKLGSSPGRTILERNRRSVKDIYKQLGKVYFQRAYRMKYSTFRRLAAALRPYIISVSGKKGTTRYIPNGPISPDVRLACAIRWFAGGSPYDIMTTYGIGHTDTINSCWYVVDAINRHPSFTIQYPDDHNTQLSIARGFAEGSSAGFQCCAGAIDGILIWIHKPSKKDCLEVGCDSGKFMCARKKKFGLNCQAVCDVRGRILDISIMYPGSTSDCLAFEGMSLFQKLEEGILAPGLCIFGDNAYLNTPFMATPYPGVSGGTKDAYNFYHSQLRIRIECTFGMLTRRWGILRSAIPLNVTVQKTFALVLALAKLHNYCIDTDGNSDLISTARDEWQNEVNGAVPLVAIRQQDSQSASGNEVIPEQLMHVGHHFNDIGGQAGFRNRQRRYDYMSRTDGVPLPRDQLHSLVASIGLTRPTLHLRRGGHNT
jgi:DDE superfamily endonuclease